MIRRSILLLLVTVLLAACGGPYVVRGRVVASPYTGIDFVGNDDDRLEQRGVGGAEIAIYRDPGRMNMALTGRVLSGGDGRFEMTLDAFGAGWMEESWRISVARSGFEGADVVLPLPAAAADRRLLIMVAPGTAPPAPEGENLWDVYERYK